MTKKSFVPALLLLGFCLCFPTLSNASKIYTLQAKEIPITEVREGDVLKSNPIENKTREGDVLREDSPFTLK